MPRRISGTANYGLYASLTKKTKKVFLRLIAAVIYDLASEELAGNLGARGIETRRERHGKYLLTAKVWLTDTVISVQATDFHGPGDDDDEDDRNDPHDICQFEFEPKRGQWRLVQVSGLPLPAPGPMNRAAEATPAGPPGASGIVSSTTNAAARLTTHIGSNLRSMIAATGSYLRRSRPIASADRLDLHANFFINYGRKGNGRTLTLITRSYFETDPINIIPTAHSWGTIIAITLLMANGTSRADKPQSNSTLFQRTQQATRNLILRDKDLLEKLHDCETISAFNEFVHMEALSRYPDRSRRLLQNLLELGTGETSITTLRRTNRDTWNSLIIQPLEDIYSRRSLYNELISPPFNSTTFTELSVFERQKQTRMTRLLQHEMPPGAALDTRHGKDRLFPDSA